MLCIVLIFENTPTPVSKQIYIPLQSVNSPTGICSDGVNAYVSNENNNNVLVIKANTNVIVNTIPVGKSPVGICYDTQFLWVANYNDGTVTQINRSTQQVVNTITVGGYPNNICSDGVNAYVSTDEGKIVVISSQISSISLPNTNIMNVKVDDTYIYVYDIITSNIIAINKKSQSNTTVYTSMNNPEFISDGKYLYIVDTNVVVIDINNSMNIVNTISIGGTSALHSISYDTSFIWVCNNKDSSISQISRSTQQVINTIQLSSGFDPDDISSDGVYVWSTSPQLNQILRYTI
jgi:YVTN family beta-propeller protein